MYLLLVFSPLLGFFSASLFGKFLGSKGSPSVAVACLGLSLLLSFFAFFEVGLMGSNVYIELGSWIKSGVLQVNWGFMFDSLSATMCVVVTFVSFLVHLYSVEYMSHDPHSPRFMSYLSLFTFFMLLLITADNFVQMFLGWEGVGLCSYLLINFWFTRIQANKAAIKAMILNRMGDFCLMIGILLIFIQYRSFDYAVIAALAPSTNFETLPFLSGIFNSSEIICVFIFLGAMGKSAQLGLHTWLPDAMEGPTPVSALIHAATMVTAGVFLVARCSFLYEYTSQALHLVTFIGASTAFFASSVGLMQNDLKRIIAYSTCSQLGYMVFACGLSNYSAGMFHLSNHAFFKALLFLSAGAVIHAVNDEQDIRKMGALKFTLRFTYFSMLMGSLALAGFPFFSGFYSKDFVLELSYGNYTVLGHYSYWLGTLGAFITSFYSTRLLCMTFFGLPNGFKYIFCFSYETFSNMSAALGMLLVPSMFIGYITKDLFIGVGSDFFFSSIYFNPWNYNGFEAEFLDYFHKILPLIFSLSGMVSAFYLYNYKKKVLFAIKLTRTGRKVYTFLNKKWFFDKLYNELIGQKVFDWGYSVSYKLIDRGVLEMLGPQGLSSVVLKASQKTHRMQSSSLYHYTLIVISAIAWLMFLNFIALNIISDYRILPVLIVSLLFLTPLKGIK